MQNKFQKNLTKDNKNIKADRAAIISKSTSYAQESLLRGLQKQENDLETKLLNLSDLSPDSAYSLHPTKGNFNAEQWVADIHKTELDLSLVRIELAVAQATWDKWFSIKKNA